MKMPLKNSLILLAAATIWGTAFVAQSAGMDYMGPLTFNGIRYFLGAGMLSPFVIGRMMLADRTRKAGDAPQVQRPSVSRILAGGALCGFFLCVASNFQQFAILSVDVGKAGFQDSEDYIRDFRLWTSSTGTSLLLEVSAVGGRFTIDFHQPFSSPLYVNAFLKELEENGIKYDLQDVMKLELPNIRYPWAE